MNEIMGAPKYFYGIDPYAWDEGRGIIRFTPIEQAIWNDIRTTDIVMYPQFPACGFFLDFANPRAKVAIECDGRAYHDKEKDAARDGALAHSGWTIYRITGSDCVKNGTEDERGTYHASPGELLCRRIKIAHSI